MARIRERVREEVYTALVRSLGLILGVMKGCKLSRTNTVFVL